MTIALRGFRALVVAGLLFAPSAAFAQDSKSTALAAELAKLLDEQKLDSVAAPHGDQFVGALYFPGSQLLVVSAKFPAADRMNYLIGQKSYKDVYIDLSSATDPKSRFFVMDLGADGLKFKRAGNNQPFDTADLLGRSVSFDGEWGRARISEDEYRKTYQSTDDQYSQMLQSLIAAIKKPS